MLKSFRNRIAFLALAAAFVAVSPAWAAKKVALVIGNGAYAEAPLKNPANDARAIAGTLRRQGFEVLLKENATKAQMNEIVADFGEKLGEGDTALFFFAGHGMQVQGRNYLIPTDARITSEQRVRLETLDVEAVLDQMAAARARVSMVILDACRNNPFERRFRSVGGGLAQINAPEGTMIAYATSPGKVAADGEGSNGLYTQELLKALAQPGLKVEDVFKQVRVGVARASNGAQVPWEASSLTGDFYFQPAALQTTAPAAAMPAPAVDREAMFWDSVKGSSDPAELRAYLDTYPTGTFAPIARARVANLESARQQQTAARTAGAPAPAPAAPPPQVAAAAPTAGTGSAYNGLYSANIPPGVVANFSTRGYATVAPGAISLNAPMDPAGPRAAGGTCGGMGPVGDDGTFAEIEILCGRIGDQKRTVMSGRVVMKGKDRHVQAVFTDVQGKATEITFK
ncbi:MAG: caspase family protein [Rhodospirillales bacterium]|nr:caspase family protein [Rhodospirillales bacterium]